MPLAPIIAKAIFDYAVEWLRDPENRDDIEAATTFIATHVASATPWKWDDQVVKAIADQVGGKLPDFGPLASVVEQLQRFIKNIPFGNVFGGR